VAGFSAREGTVSNYMTHCETTFADWRDAAIIAAGLPRRLLAGPSASLWRIGTGVAHLQARSPGSGAAAHGAVPSPQAPAWGTLRVRVGGSKNRRDCGEPGRPLCGGSLPRRSLAGLPRAEPRGDTSRGIENKPLRAFSNRKSNDSRKPATLSEPTTSNFLIATKTHSSEEKAKRE
jgi:hypothetical protein